MILPSRYSIIFPIATGWVYRPFWSHSELLFPSFPRSSQLTTACILVFAFYNSCRLHIILHSFHMRCPLYAVSIYILSYNFYLWLFQWPRGLRRRSSAARLLRLWVLIPPGAWMFFCCECCVLLGRGLCDGLTTRPEESYRLLRIIVCDQETSKTRRLKPATGLWKYNHNGL